MLHLHRAAMALILVLPGAGAAQEATLSAVEARTLGPLAAVPREVAFSPDAQLVATSAVDGSIALWKVANGAPVRRLTHPQGVTSIAFSRDGQLLASAGYDHMIRIWRTADGALLHTLRGHTGTVWTVAFSPDGATIASGGEDRTVRLWRAADGALL